MHTKKDRSRRHNLLLSADRTTANAQCTAGCW